MERKRWYEDACGAAHALDIVGERWALLVIRELMFGPRRFGELRANLPGISANILTQRLEGLEREGVVVRRKLPPPASVQVYELTPWGYEAEPIFQTLGRWATRSPTHDPTLPISNASLLLSFRTMIDAAKARGLGATIALRLGNEDYVARLADGAIAIARGEAEAADLRIAATAAALGAAIYGGAAFETLEAQGVLALEGDRALARRFATLFPLPEKADAPPPPA